MPKPDTMTAATVAAAQRVQEQGAAFASIDAYVAEVKRLLIEKDLRAEWADELLSGDAHYLKLAFERYELPVEAAFEVYITEEDSAREPVPEDQRLKLDINEQVKAYLQQLVNIGLWGDSIERVAASLIHQQLASKLEAGLVSQAPKK